jgi:predicted  nucleic acid-binding Zn-ribbon protein
MVVAMGLFDSFRRKKKERPKPVLATEAKGEKQRPSKAGSFSPLPGQDDVNELLKKRAELYGRREALQHERESLTAQLDNGELSASDFRKELMARIQEASQVSEGIREIDGLLSALGHRVVGG